MNHIIAIAAAIFGTIYLSATWNLPELRISEVVGPKVFPTLIGIGILGCAVLIALEGRGKADRTSVSEGDAMPPKADPKDDDAGKRVLAVFGLLLVTLLYTFLLERIGYLILTPIFIFGIASFFNRKAHVTNALVAVGFGIGVYLLFNEFLGVRLPLGLMDMR